MEQKWAPCIFGCCGVGAQDHVRHYFDDCILWNHVQDCIPEFLADMGADLFGVHLQSITGMQYQILGVAFATQLYLMKKHHMNADTKSLSRALWLSKPFYFQCFRQILKLAAPASRNLSSAPLVVLEDSSRECDSPCFEASASSVCQNFTDEFPVGLSNSSSKSQADCVDASRSRLVDDDWGEVVDAQFTVDRSVGCVFEGDRSFDSDRPDDLELELKDIDSGEQ